MALAEIFYHVYIPADGRAAMWTWYIDQQLSLIKQSKLVDIANVNMTITMPKYWTEIFGQCFVRDFNPTKPITNVNGPNIEITFETKVVEYINFRYPFVKILDIRDMGEPNIFEGLSLKALHDKCCNSESEFNVLYIHTKGSTSTRDSASMNNWRELLNHLFINEWPRCTSKLTDFDLVGMKDYSSNDFILSGNFWWAKSSYIKTLADPLKSNQYMGMQTECYPGQPLYRYSFERWVMTNKPKLHYMLDTKINHYSTYYFIEDLPK